MKLALEILDGSSVRGHTIHVERVGTMGGGGASSRLAVKSWALSLPLPSACPQAHFQMKGEYNPSLKKKKKNKKKGRGQEK